MRLVPDPLPDDEDEFALTPRQLHIVAVVARTLADSAYDDIAEHGDTPVTAPVGRSVFGEFPPATWSQSAAWRRQAARAFDDLAADVETGRPPRPRCTGEEMALHLILHRAAALQGRRPLRRSTGRHSCPSPGRRLGRATGLPIRGP